jgi:hypothetical protein|tara:strand:- start:222 stop:467 length:246 start_codon:yes stop_codon:yes gene_type:complete
MKFVLIMTVCSSIYQSCTNPIHVGDFSSWNSCAIDGYSKSIDLLEKLGDKKVNEDRSYISFICKEVEDKIIIPLPKPKVEI